MTSPISATGGASGTTVEDHTLDGPHGPLPVRAYQPAPEAANGIGLVWAHGGAFIFGDIDMPEAHDVSLALAAQGVTVVSVDYRLAPTMPGTAEAGFPEHDGVRFPVASEEVPEAFPLGLAGRSAP
ncbi:alpha/beta hydrolase fold domain-containing protein [Nonomuraea sp. NPDC049695]|uniref:alpha/beta hydrolase fold domain-containing protein n=1 Tax=Nonomuraea sp. NPDC049695 TaxID=3154734 RepID=UPI003431DE4E